MSNDSILFQYINTLENLSGILDITEKSLNKLNYVSLKREIVKSVILRV
jgi:hypothetical protein